MMQSRTHTCGELRLADAGRAVKLCGWMENVREVSSALAFVVVRDFYGTTQVVAETEEMVKAFKAITRESTISVEGTVRERASKNPHMDTGDIEVVPEKVEVLMADAGIVRNRAKIQAAIQNAGVFLAIQKEFGSFDRYLWGFTDGKVILNTDDVFHTSTDLSDKISKDLKRRGMKFVGTTIIYSFLQAVGVVNDHELACFCHPSHAE